MTLSTLLTSAVHADTAISIGKNCARVYHTSPARWQNNKVNLNCISVRHIKHAPRVDGVTFSVTHTFGRKAQKIRRSNHCRCFVR